MPELSGVSPDGSLDSPRPMGGGVRSFSYLTLPYLTLPYLTILKFKNKVRKLLKRKKMAAQI